MTRLLTPRLRVGLLVGALAGVTALLWATGAPIQPTSFVPVPWPVLLVLFVLSEIFVVHAQFRKEAHSFTMSEAPLVVGLFAVPFPVLFVVRIAASTIALGVFRRQRGQKLAFNIVSTGLEVTLAASILRLLAGPSPAPLPPPWLSVGVATVATGAVASIVVLAAVTLSGERQPISKLGRVLAAGTMTSLLNTSIGLIGVTILATTPRAASILLLPTGLLLLGYRRHGMLQQQHGSLAVLHGFSQEVGGSVDIDGVAGLLLERARDLLRADTAALVLTNDDAVLAWAANGDEPAAPVAAPEDEPLCAWLRTVSDPVCLASGALGPSPGVGAIGPAPAGVRDVLALPLGEGLHGAVAVADSLGDFRTFTDRDLQLLGTLVNHAGSALRNSRLVAELRRQAAVRAHEATHDALTGLPNRTLFRQHALDAISARLADGGSAAVMLMDLDRFKEVNDTLGHHSGDALLRQIGRRLVSALGSDGIIARLGGDEFAVLLPAVADQRAAIEIGSRLRTALQAPFDIGFMTLEVEASVGIAMCPEHGAEPESLLQRADVAMYLAKAGTGEPEVYDAARDTYSPRRLALVGELRRAIEQDELVLHYQPQVALRTGEIVGVEALVRWQHPRMGLVMPDEFVQAAEHTELLRPFTRWTLREALRQQRAWLDEGVDLEVAVNLSPRALLDADLPRDLALLLSEFGTDPERITLELTESSIVAETGRTAGVLATLGAMRVRLSIDDFGTGYSSLSHLKRYTVHELKIDRSFITHLTANPDDAAIVRSTIDLARGLDLSVVAEGVEDVETVATLRAFGCHAIQGYLLSRPAPAGHIARWTREWPQHRSSITDLPSSVASIVQRQHAVSAGGRRR